MIGTERYTADTAPMTGRKGRVAISITSHAHNANTQKTVRNSIIMITATITVMGRLIEKWLVEDLWNVQKRQSQLEKKRSKGEFESNKFILIVGVIPSITKLLLTTLMLSLARPLNSLANCSANRIETA